jgi:hypothetical protein
MVSVVLGDVDPDHFGQHSCQFLGPLSLHKVPTSGQRAANAEVKLALLLATNYVSHRLLLDEVSYDFLDDVLHRVTISQMRLKSAR